ncbi:conserved hypothetical protein [Culex quinquefasciatus]|uniref:Uncharacterized protein n=1 Tax=Culex quinquefasciatus TaxID=7176 RepID=B0XFP2_CULQU|nr:conserved hypothetical protein [Culex quinquefasciatus]|eukprot:XP_001868464.1 conserved hypothetical protein [Culex quinquefasciatus]
MSAAYVLLVLTSFASIVFACNYPMRHYKSMGCIASNQKSSNGCPAHFDCPNLTDRKSDKCYIHGKVYDIGERVPSEETAGSCTILFCSSFNDTAHFSIAIIDCVEFFAPSGIDCVRQYRRGQCCSYGSVCGNSRNNLRTCSVGNETLYEGQRVESHDHKCHYGNLTLNVGDVLESETTAQGTISCRCEIPPMVHCELDNTKTLIKLFEDT